MLGFLSGTVFSYMLVIGFIFSTVTFIVSMAGASGDIGSDAGDLADSGFDGDASDGGSSSFMLTFFPMSPVVWCIFLLLAGTVGEIMTRAAETPFALRLAISVVVGYVVMILFNKCLLLPMKQAKHYTNSEDDLIGAEAVVFETIAAGESRKGAIQVRGASGSVIYTAVSEDGSEIASGSIVRVVDLSEDKTATVIPDPAQKFFDSVDKEGFE